MAGSPVPSERPARLALFATAARGTEPLLADELRELGMKRVRQDRGGVRFEAHLAGALRCCLWSRIAMRVLYPLGRFEARGAEGLYDAARQVAWEDYLRPDTTFAVEATMRASEHRHSGFVALKIKDAIVDRLRDLLGSRPDVDPRRPAVQVVAHLAGDRLALSLDLCGEPLFQRGYRQAGGVAPMKETLAAAILRGVGYKGEESLVDPMCGSATLLIEGAMIAANRACGLGRSLAVERWPFLGEEARRLTAELRAEALAAQRVPPFPLLGFDKSERALEIARRNVAAAGVAAWVRLAVGDAAALEPPPAVPAGLLVTNPPYGERLEGGGQKSLKTFYFRLGKQLATWTGWRLAILAGHRSFESAFHMRPRRRHDLWNGPIACTLLEYEPGSMPRRSKGGDEER